MKIKAGPDWFENEEFWLKYKPLMFDRDREEDTGLEVDAMLKLAGAKESLAVLDVCCGYGRHDMFFAKKGHKVCGTDISSVYLDQARADAARQGLDIEFIKTDARDFVRKGEFDLAVNYFSSFGYFEESEDDLKLARNVYDSLKPGGIFLIETRSKETACLQFKEREWFQRDGFIIILEYKLIDACTKMRNRWLFIGDSHQPGDELTEVEYDIRLYSALEMGMLLSEAGFDEIEFYGGIDGREFDHNAETMVALARKLK